MKRTSTVTHEFEANFDWIEFVDKVIVTYKQGDTIVLEKTEKDVTFNGKVLTVELSANDTKSFNVGHINIEIKALTKNGQNINSDKILRSVEDVLNDKVLV
jgi:hypothetical protein